MRRFSLASLAALSLLLSIGCEKKLAKPAPDTVAVTLAPADVSADQGVTSASALVTEQRVPLERIAVRFQIALVAATGANPTYAEIVAETDVNGIASADLTGLQQAGAGQVIATAMREESEGVLVPRLDENDAPIAGSAALRVLPGVATSMAVSLNPTAVNPANGDFTDVSWVVRDAQGNRTADAVEIATDHPGATVLGARLENLGLAGAWSVAVSVTGRPQVSDAENFTVLPGTAQMIDTFLSNSTTDAYANPLLHPPVAVSYQVTDASGNDVTLGANVVCGIDVLSGGGIASGVIAPLVIKGTFPVTCSLFDGANALVSKDTETLTVIDLTPPTATIISPAPGTHFQTGTEFTVQVRGQDVVAVSQLTGQLVGLGELQTQSQLVASLSKDVTVPLPFKTAGPDKFGGTMTLYALGADGSGNLANAPSVSIIVDPFVFLAAGITPELVREDARIETPRAIAADPLSANETPELYVADQTANGGTIWKISYDRALKTSSITSFVSGIGAVRGVEWNATGDRLHATIGGDVVAYDRAGVVQQTISPAGATRLEHLAFGAGGFLYAADSANSTVYQLNVAAGTSAVFANSATPVANGGSPLAAPVGVGYDPATASLFVSDINNDIVYELFPDGADAGTITDSLRRFMDKDLNLGLGPNPDVPRGLAYKGAGGTYAEQLLVANDGNREVYNAVRDGADADLFSDGWTTFLESSRSPLDMGFHPNGHLYMVFAAGNAMDAHVVELSGF